MSSVLEAVASSARHRPDHIALTDGRESLTYAGLWRESQSWIDILAALVDRTDTVGLRMDNSSTWVLLDLALAALGSPIVPLPPFFTEGQCRHALMRSGAQMLITDHELAGFASPKIIKVTGRSVYLHHLEAPEARLPRDTAKVTFTSGTTGEPKGVCLPQAELERIAHTLVEAIGQEYAGVHCAVLSLAILLENVAGLYPTLLVGGHYHAPSLAAIGFSRAFSPNYLTLARAIEESGATSTIVVPEILRGLTAALAQEKMALPAMKLLAVGGARISPKVLDDAASLGLPVFQGYGLSETGSVIALNVPKRNRPGSVGRPLPGIELDLAPDGEIMVAAPAFRGYVGEGVATERLATGDIGRFDEEGYLYVEGRKGNLLITGFGRNVAPEWIESELLSQPGIGQAFVFGEGEPALGALIVPSSANVAEEDLAEAIAEVNRHLPEYAEVKHWTRVSPFTVVNRQLTTNGRMRREEIVRDHQQLMTACFQAPGRHVSFFERLIAATATERSMLLTTPQVRDGLAGRISLSSYIHYLAEAYHHVKHTVSLMQLANQGLSPDRASLKEALARYIAEETGHEEWILEDIVHAGGNAQSVRDGEPRFATELMVAYAYDFIARVNPVGFFGMVFVLESSSEQLATRGAHALMQTLKLPPDCFHYLLSHGAVDVDHMGFFRNLMFQIEEPRDQAAVVHMAKAMYRLYADVFRSIPHHPRADAHGA